MPALEGPQYGSVQRRGSLSSSASYDDDGRCAICLHDYSDDTEDNVTKQACGHRFHESCLRNWSLADAAQAASSGRLVQPMVPCPLCRHLLERPAGTGILSAIGQGMVQALGSQPPEIGRTTRRRICGRWHDETVCLCGTLMVTSYFGAYIALFYLLFHTVLDTGRPIDAGDVILLFVVSCIALAVWTMLGRALVEYVVGRLRIGQYQAAMLEAQRELQLLSDDMDDN